MLPEQGAGVPRITSRGWAEGYSSVQNGTELNSSVGAGDYQSQDVSWRVGGWNGEGRRRQQALALLHADTVQGPDLPVPTLEDQREDLVADLWGSYC